MKLAFLGTGLMGAPMARRLLAAGHDVAAWNRTPEKAASLAKDGATVADTPATAVDGAEIVVSMLADGQATASVQAERGLREALARSAEAASAAPIWVEMSSVRPDEARAQSADMASLGVAHLDAPVSGGTRGAADGALAIMAGGDPDAFARARPALSAMGVPVLVGPSGAGQLAKLANQAIVAIAISAVAEATLLLERGGADPAAVREALRGGFADSVILQQHGARMSERNFDPGGPSRLQLKDLDNVAAEAEKLGLRLPATSHVRERYARLCNELEGAELDHSALYLELVALCGDAAPQGPAGSGGRDGPGASDRARGETS